MRRYLAHAGIGALLTGHILFHFASEAFHEMVVEVSISPAMHVVEHIVARVMDGEHKLDEASAAVAKNPNVFHAHHHTQEAN